MYVDRKAFQGRVSNPLLSCCWLWLGKLSRKRLPTTAQPPHISSQYHSARILAQASGRTSLNGAVCSHAAARPSRAQRIGHASPDAPTSASREQIHQLSGAVAAAARGRTNNRLFRRERARSQKEIHAEVSSERSRPKHEATRLCEEEKEVDTVKPWVQSEDSSAENQQCNARARRRPSSSPSGAQSL